MMADSNGSFRNRGIIRAISPALVDNFNIPALVRSLEIV